MKVRASITNPPTASTDFHERCHGPDGGLVNSWLCGVRQGLEDPSIAIKAKAGELPVLIWKGGIAKAIKSKCKIGSLQYLAAWQGLRGDDLNIDLGVEVKMICTRFSVPVLFTDQLSKLLEADEDVET